MKQHEMNTKASNNENHHDPKANPNKRRKIQNDYANDNEEKNIIDDSPNATVNHLIVARLILVDYGEISGLMTATDLNNYLQVANSTNFATNKIIRFFNPLLDLLN